MAKAFVTTVYDKEFIVDLEGPGWMGTVPQIGKSGAWERTTDGTMIFHPAHQIRSIRVPKDQQG